MKILAISGSLRAVSSNTALLRAAAMLAPPGLEIDVYGGLGDLPHFNPDLEGHEPPAVIDFIARVRAADGLLISSPEYAHGVPGAMKNALDWLVSDEKFMGKPVALFNASPLASYAQAALLETITVMSARVVSEAFIAVPVSGKKLDEAGIAADPEIAGTVRAALEAFARAIEIPASRAFLEARDFLIAHRDDYATAYAGFRWPVLEEFNWALDYFDVYARGTSGGDRTALWVVDDEGGETKLSFAQLAERSNRVANHLRAGGVRRGDRILVMLPNVAPLWEIMLAAIKLGAVVSPASTLLSAADLHDRIERGEMRHVISDVPSSSRFAEVPGRYTRIVVGEEVAGWLPYAAAAEAPAAFEPDGPTRADDPFLLYFTSGTTAKPKMVLHTHQSYPVGHLSTMYWIGLREGDVHLNISSPGWAKHAWSCFFAPWNAGATIFIHQLPRFDGRKTLAALARHGVTTLCAPPTVWRMLILEDLKAYPVKLRELVSAGEPLNPEVIAQVREAWGLTVRDGYGQTETTCQIGNPPGEEVKVGGMGKPLPGYRIDLLDADGNAGEEGEIAIRLDPRPLPLMAGYLDNPESSAKLLGGSHYRTSDVATRDAGGTFWYVGRADDVFKSSDYRISPFELESALMEHESVAEAAVVPSPDPIRLSVPKAYVVLKPGVAPSMAAAHALFRFSRQRLAPFARIRRIEFAELPKTISGKIRRVQLRAMEKERHLLNVRGDHEYWEDDFIDLD